MNQLVYTLSAFSAGTLAALGVSSLLFDLVLRDRSRINERFRQRFQARMKNRAQQSTLFKKVIDLSTGEGSEQASLEQRLQMLIEQSGVPISDSQFLTIAVSFSIGGAAMGLTILPHWSLMVLGAVVGFLIPWGYLLIKRRRRLARFCAQLPEAFELMCRSVRSGQTIMSALQLVSQECRPPISEEFAYCCEQQNLGLPFDVTLHDLANRNDIMELRMFVVALLVQRQSGSNPVEMLEQLSQRIRKRIRLRDHVRTLTSEGRLQAVVLAVLPIFALAGLMAIKPEYAQELLDRPRLLAGLLVAQVAGAVWIRKILNFDY